MAIGFISVVYKNGLEQTVSTVFIDDYIYLYSDGRKYCSICREWVEVLTSKKDLEKLGIKFKNE